MPEPVRVKGLKQLSRSLRAIDNDLPKGLRVALNGSADFLIDATRPKIPRRSGRAAGSLKARSTRTSVRIGVGGAKAPYYPWLDFGGAVGRDNSITRPFYKAGRYLYPTLGDNKAQFTDIMTDALVSVVKGAGLEISR